MGLAERIRTGDVVADLLRPVPPVLSYLATVVSFACRYTYELADDASAGELVARLATVAPLRDLAVVEPEIEDVIARLYAG